jgi:hypothetical protein
VSASGRRPLAALLLSAAALACGCGRVAGSFDALAASNASAEAAFAPARAATGESPALEPFIHPPPERAPGLRVPVRLAEWTVTLPGRLPAGTITFLVRNRGHEDHAFHIWGRGVDQATRVIEPAMRTSLTVTLARGVYHVECPVKEPEEREDHAKMGMTGTVRVY